jgi:hypothetical protein
VFSETRIGCNRLAENQACLTSLHARMKAESDLRGMDSFIAIMPVKQIGRDASFFIGRQNDTYISQHKNLPVTTSSSEEPRRAVTAGHRSGSQNARQHGLFSVLRSSRTLLCSHYITCTVPDMAQPCTSQW